MARIISLLAVLTFAGCNAATESPSRDIDYYLANPTPLRLVQVLSGKNNDERREIVSQALAAFGIAHARQPFQSADLGGENLLVEFGPGPQAVVIVTHFDRVADSPGANDNASCVAAAIDGLRQLASQPPDHIKLVLLFSDLEEAALAGSRQYARSTDLSNVIGAISFDLCGIGDAVGIWDLRQEEASALIVRALMRASEQEGVYHSTHGPVARFSSDHISFFEKGVPGVGVTIVPREDEARLRAYVDNPNSIRWLIRYFRPRIFRTYHTSEDGPQTVAIPALDLARRVIVGTVRALDAPFGRSTHRSGARRTVRALDRLAAPAS